MGRRSQSRPPAPSEEREAERGGEGQPPRWGGSGGAGAGQLRTAPPPARDRPPAGRCRPPEPANLSPSARYSLPGPVSTPQDQCRPPARYRLPRLLPGPVPVRPDEPVPLLGPVPPSLGKVIPGIWCPFPPRVRVPTPCPWPVVSVPFVPLPPARGQQSKTSPARPGSLSPSVLWPLSEAGATSPEPAAICGPSSAACHPPTVPAPLGAEAGQSRRAVTPL